MRRVDRESDLDAAFRDASSEAERAFGNGELYIEKVVLQPRHIVVADLADRPVAEHLAGLADMREVTVADLVDARQEEAWLHEKAPHEQRRRARRGGRRIADDGGFAHGGTP